jgi:cephalosporin hydroxylase
LKDYWHDFSYTSFGGIPMAQFWCDIYLWEAVLNSNTHLKRIVELGTWMGGFSLFLQMQAEARDMTFFTYDSIVFREDVTKNLPFTKLDIWANIDFLGDLMSKEATLLFCDNGNKPRELKTFAPYLTSDSIVIVHDWMTETFPKDIPDYLEEIYGDFCDDIGSISRVFRKKVE